MRIVYIHQYFRTPEMAGGTRSYEFARRLVERGHDVVVITADPQASEEKDLPRWRTSNESGVTVHWARVAYAQSMPTWRRMVAFVMFVLAAGLKAGRIPADLVLASSTPLTVAIPGAWVSLRRRIPMVLEVRDLWPAVPIAMGVLRSVAARKLAYWLEAWAYRRATAIVALSPDMARGVASVLPEAEVHVIPNACDVDLFSSNSPADEALRERYSWIDERQLVLYAGSFGKVNGVDYLVDLAAALRTERPTAVVVMIGSGSEMDYVRRRAVDAGVLGENCYILESVPKEEVAAWFRACSVATSTVINIPELEANSANKFFDSLAAGRPIALNHGGWLADLLKTTGAGVVLPRDPSLAGVVLAEFLEDPTALEAARAAAASLAEEFDRDRLAAKLDVVLSTVVTRRVVRP